MSHDSLRVELAGREVPSLYPDLLALEVELDEELTGMCRLTLAIASRPGGGWTHLDDGRLLPWQPIRVVAGLAGDTRELLSGYLTHVRPDLGEGLDECRLEVWGMDAGVLLDRADVARAWPNKTDSDIARETFRTHGLDPVVTDTAVVHDERVSTIVQRETDLQFLQRLALRNGFECYVQGRTGHFGPPSTAPAAVPPILVGTADTPVLRFAWEVNAVGAADVVMTQVDRLTAEVLDARSQRAPALAPRPPANLLGRGVPAGLVRVGQTVATGRPEMAALCQGLHDRGEWIVTAEGELDSHRYGGVLRPRTTVEVLGLGTTHSGRYQVARVTHAFTRDGYRQGFVLRRNGLGSAVA